MKQATGSPPVSLHYLRSDLTVVDIREGEGDFQMEDIHLPVDFHIEDSHSADSLAGEDNLLVAGSLAEEDIQIGDNLLVADNLAEEDIQPVPAYKLAFAVQQRCR